jgi:hypothetical protein
MVCPAAINLAIVVGHSGCFATIAFSMTDAWLSLVSLADALLPLSLASLGQMLCCRMCYGRSPCGCFVTLGIFASSMADA